MAIFQNTCAGWIEPASIVADAQLQALRAEAERHLDLCWMGMLRGVGHGLLAYAQQVALNERFRLALCALNGKVQVDTGAVQRSLAHFRKGLRKRSGFFEHRGPQFPNRVARLCQILIRLIQKLQKLRFEGRQ